MCEWRRFVRWAGWRALIGALVLTCSSTVSALTPTAVEIMTLDRQMAEARCHELRDALELMVALATGHAARAAEIERRTKAPHSPDHRAQVGRREELLQSQALPAADRAAINDARSRLEAFCPYEKEPVPRDLPRAVDDAMALDYLLAFAPRTLAKLRLCEVFLPERRGLLERTWAGSTLSRLVIPRLRDAVDPVRAWMKEDLGPPAPGSKPAIDLTDPNKRRQQEAICDALPSDLRRIEAALPPSFMQKFIR